MADAFDVRIGADGANLPLLVHVPHGATAVPAPWRDGVALPDDALRAELARMTDHHTEALFAQPPASTDGVLFVNRLSRLVFDPERFEDDAREPMASVGMGAVYVRTSDGRPLRGDAFGPGDRERVLASLFRPYARAFAGVVDDLLARFDRCLIVDAHSFPTDPLPYEDARLARPDVCLGFDDVHGPIPLVEALERVVRGRGLASARNTPFGGSYVPARHHRRDRRVASVMIELRRGLYMDEDVASDGARASGFGDTRALVRALLDAAARWLRG